MSLVHILACIHSAILYTIVLSLQAPVQYSTCHRKSRDRAVYTPRICVAQQIMQVLGLLTHFASNTAHRDKSQDALTSHSLFEGRQELKQASYKLLKTQASRTQNFKLSLSRGWGYLLLAIRLLDIPSCLLIGCLHFPAATAVTCDFFHGLSFPTDDYCDIYFLLAWILTQVCFDVTV
ncbi:hypothetical protein I7I48_06493 [Histoplasma ohiense]|nr:hypothetical protein I7I48_06493 [Histoplasma ohiense (nom. inval.)]